MSHFRVTAKSYNDESRTAETMRVTIVKNSQRSKASNAILLTYISTAGKGGGLQVLPRP